MKALKRKFAARENEQPEEQEAQRSTKRALVADMDDVSDSPRILSCQRWRVLPSPLGAHNQQVQTWEGAAGPKAPTPLPRPPTSLSQTCWSRSAGWGTQPPGGPLRRRQPPRQRRRPHSASCLACLTPQQAPTPAPPSAPGRGLALRQLQLLLLQDLHLQRRRQRRQGRSATCACTWVAPLWPPAPLCSQTGSQRCTGTAAAGWVWQVVMYNVGMRDI